MAKNLKVLSGYVIVEQDVVSDKTESGIFISTRQLPPPNSGTVVAVNMLELDAKVGDKVWFQTGKGHEISWNGKTYLAFENKHIIASL